MGIAAQIVLQKATIAAAGTVSTAVGTGKYGLLCGIYMPATLVGASVAITVSDEENGTYAAPRDAAGNVLYAAIPFTANAYIALDTNVTAGFKFVKVTSASTETNGAEFVLSLKSAA